MIRVGFLCQLAGLSLLSCNHKVEQPCKPWEQVWKLNFVVFTQGAEISAKLHIGPAGSRIWPQIVRILDNDKGILGVLSIVPNCLEISIETLDPSGNFFAKMVYLWNSFPLIGWSGLAETYRGSFT